MRSVRQLRALIGAKFLSRKTWDAWWEIRICRLRICRNGVVFTVVSCNQSYNSFTQFILRNVLSCFREEPIWLKSHQSNDSLVNRNWATEMCKIVVGSSPTSHTSQSIPHYNPNNRTLQSPSLHWLLINLPGVAHVQPRARRIDQLINQTADIPRTC